MSSFGREQLLSALQMCLLPDKYLQMTRVLVDCFLFDSMAMLGVEDAVYHIPKNEHYIYYSVITWYDALLDRWWLTSYILLNTTPKPQSKISGNRTRDPANLRVTRQKPTPPMVEVVRGDLSSRSVFKHYAPEPRGHVLDFSVLEHVFENHKSVPIRLQVLRRASLIHNDTYTLDTAELGFGQEKYSECGCYYSTQQCGLVRVHSEHDKSARACGCYTRAMRMRTLTRFYRTGQVGTKGSNL